MRNHCMDNILTHACLTKKLRCFQAVFLRIKFEIDIMEKSYDSPVFRVITIAQLFRIPFHHCLHSQRMLDVKRILVVFF